MAGSMDRCEISTTNSPGTGAGTASLVNSQSPGRGRPDGRAARRTWRLVCGTGITYPERTSVLLKARVPTAPWLTLWPRVSRWEASGSVSLGLALAVVDVTWFVTWFPA